MDTRRCSARKFSGMTVQPHPLGEAPPEHGQYIVTGTGFRGQARRLIRAYVKSLGGIYSGDLMYSSTTHLVVADLDECRESEKLNRARDWRLPIVSYLWILESLSNGFFVPLKPYLLMDGIGAADTAPRSGNLGATRPSPASSQNQHSSKSGSCISSSSCCPWTDSDDRSCGADSDIHSSTQPDQQVEYLPALFQRFKEEGRESECQRQRSKDAPVASPLGAATASNAGQATALQSSGCDREAVNCAVSDAMESLVEWEGDGALFVPDSQPCDSYVFAATRLPQRLHSIGEETPKQVQAGERSEAAGREPQTADGETMCVGAARDPEKEQAASVGHGKSPPFKRSESEEGSLNNIGSLLREIEWSLKESSQRSRDAVAADHNGLDSTVQPGHSEQLGSVCSFQDVESDRGSVGGYSTATPRLQCWAAPMQTYGSGQENSEEQITVLEQQHREPGLRAAKWTSSKPAERVGVGSSNTHSHLTDLQELSVLLNDIDISIGSRRQL